MSYPEIETLISSTLPENVTLVEIKSTKLTSSGDNYGSTLSAVDATVRNEHEDEDHIYLVAKKVPQNELVQEMFNCVRTFPNEVGFYQKIVPCLRHFQEECGTTKLIDSFPDFYAASSVLLIKNIKKEGYDILDRTVGFDLPQSMFILDKMAELHATAIALKTQKSRVFETELAQFFEEFEIFVMDDDSNNKMIQGVLDVIKDDEVCKNHLGQFEDVLQKSSVISCQKNIKVAFGNQFSTLVHSDLWTNNIMVKIDKGRIAGVKFVDYQLYEYSSLTRDVLFFIFSSISVAILKQQLEFLLEHYYNSFVTYLTTFQVDSKIFSYQSYLEDMKNMAKKYEFFHIMTMLPPIYATSKDTKEVEHLEMDSFIFHDSEVTKAHREKACFTAREFLGRGWLL